MASGTHSVIFATGEPAYAVDRDGTIVAWNTAASRAFGYPGAQALGRKCWELLQGQDAFGNQYCCERCPLREMAFQHKPVNRCRMSFRTDPPGATVWRKSYAAPESTWVELGRTPLDSALLALTGSGTS
jgi:PAS domain S-box-containing protein